MSLKKKEFILQTDEDVSAERQKTMNSRKVNLAFLLSVLLYIGMAWCAVFLMPKLFSDLTFNNLACELTILLPGLLFLLFSKEKVTEFLGFHKMKTGTALAIIPFTMFSMPVITLLNLISQFWVRNEAAAMMEGFQVTRLPLAVLLFSTGLLGPFCEEVICRGIYYRGYCRSGGRFWAMLLSALLFSLVHMNLNQAVYAFAVGVLAVLLTEATGSLWASVLYHGLINSSQTVLLYGALKLNPQAYTQTAEQVQAEGGLIYGVAGYLVLAAVTLPLAWALLVWMGEHEGRKGVLSSLWKERKREEKGGKKERLVTLPLILGIAICVLVSTFLM